MGDTIKLVKTEKTNGVKPLEHFIESLVVNFSLPILFVIIAITLYTLSKGADILVTEAVFISEKMGISKMIIGATIVSVGTTLPEASVSVLAAATGDASLALGNAVGSVICDTGLILGIATLMSPLPLQKEIVNRHGWIQFGSGILLVLVALPYSNLGEIFTEGSRIPQFVGFIFIGLLIGYIYLTIKWARRSKAEFDIDEFDTETTNSNLIVFIKFVIGVAIVILSSKVLIPTVKETALRLSVPDSVIAATLVAFGTSLPELVTSITAVLKGHGELAVGNVIGADILNILFVIGAATSFSRGGIIVEPSFFKLYFPTMIFILLIFRIGTLLYKDKLKRPFGVVLLMAYILISALSYL